MYLMQEHNLHGHDDINKNYTDNRFVQREPCFGLRRKTVRGKEKQVRLMKFRLLIG